MSAAGLVAIATGFATRTTLIACAAFTAVVATLALVTRFGTSLLGTTVATFMLLTAFMLAAAFMLLTAFMLAATFMLLTAFVLAAAFMFLATFVTATARRIADGADDTFDDHIHILLNTRLYHFAYAFRCQRCTSDTVNLSLGLAGTFLHDGKSHLAVSHHGTTDELALELLFLDEST